MSQAPETLLLSRHKQVAIITLNRPQALNAINLQMRGELFDVLEALRKDPEVRALVLTGGGDKAFCAGMDLREFSQILLHTPLTELRRFRWEKSDALAQFDKPVIAAVKGLAVGGGVELALQCDVCYAGESASFAFAEVSRGHDPRQRRDPAPVPSNWHQSRAGDDFVGTYCGRWRGCSDRSGQTVWSLTRTCCQAPLNWLSA